MAFDRTGLDFPSVAACVESDEVDASDDEEA